MIRETSNVDKRCTNRHHNNGHSVVVIFQVPETVLRLPEGSALYP
jgi:hypothetical protein